MSIKRLIGVMAAVAAVMSLSVAGTASAATQAQVIKAAKAEAAKYTKQVKSLGLKPTKKAVPKGKKLTVISCGVCGPQNIGIKAAGAKLGWTVNVTTYSSTPEGMASAWTSAVQADPDAIIAIAQFPLTGVKNQIAQAKAKGIIVVTQGAADTHPVGGSSGIAADASGANQFGLLGRLYADVPIADAGKGPNAALIIDPAVPAWKALRESFAKQVKASGGTPGQIDVGLAEIGKGAPQRVVSYLQSHPNVKYLVFTVPAFYLGVKQALQSAGLFDKVKIVIGAADKVAIGNITSGDAIAGVALETRSGGWWMTDAVARKMTGSKVKTHILVNVLIVTKSKNSNLGDKIDTYPNLNAQFVKAWKGPVKKK